jgi:hypothetical protein
MGSGAAIVGIGLMGQNSWQELLSLSTNHIALSDTTSKVDLCCVCGGQVQCVGVNPTRVLERSHLCHNTPLWQHCKRQRPNRCYACWFGALLSVCGGADRAQQGRNTLRSSSAEMEHSHHYFILFLGYQFIIEFVTQSCWCWWKLLMA